MAADRNEITETDDINQFPGGGIVGKLREIGVAIGNRRYMHAIGIRTKHLEDEIGNLSASGINPILIRLAQERLLWSECVIF